MPLGGNLLLVDSILGVLSVLCGESGGNYGGPATFWKGGQCFSMDQCHARRMETWGNLLKGLLVLGLLALVVGVAACSLGPGKAPEPATQPNPVKTKRATFTPTSQVPLTPTPLPIVPSPTPEPASPTATLRPVDTPLPPTPTPQSTPVVEVATETLNVRSGPGTTYPRVGKAKRGDRVEVLAQSPAGEWYLVCCVGDEEGWVAAEYVQLVEGTTAAIAVTTAIPPTPKPRATNTPAPPPTPTSVPATPTPSYLFAAREVTGYAYDKPYLTIKGKIWDVKAKKALEGYRLKVFRNGADVGLSEVSWPGFSDSTCPTCGDNRPINVKYEYNPAGDAQWEVYVVDGAGTRVSESLTLASSTASPQWFYVDFALR